MTIYRMEAFNKGERREKVFEFFFDPHTRNLGSQIAKLWRRLILTA